MVHSFAGKKYLLNLIDTPVRRFVGFANALNFLSLGVNRDMLISLGKFPDRWLPVKEHCSLSTPLKAFRLSLYLFSTLPESGV